MPVTDRPSLITLRTLGPPVLVTADGTVLLPVGKPLAVLLYLALAPGRTAQRETLIDLLWGDAKPTTARSNLRQVVFQLRRVLGDEALRGTETLELVHPLTVDRDVVTAALDAGQLDEALATYRGAFLDRFGTPGGARFEQWADLERERLEAGLLRAIERAVRSALDDGRISDARHLARSARDRAPTNAIADRLVLEVALAARDEITASMESRALEERARIEGEPLDAATRALVARAQTHAPDVGDPDEERELVAELTGREEEFAAMTSAWRAVRRGPARVIHLVAQAGLGKSRLLREVLARLASQEARVVYLAARQGDRDLPYAFLADLAAMLAPLPGALGVSPGSAAALVALNPSLSRRFRVTTDADAPHLTSATSEKWLRVWVLALVDLMQAIADEQRFVLAIDDLHWVDVASRQVLDSVVGRVREAHLLLITAARPSVTALVSAADDGPHALTPVLALRPLSAAQIRTMLASLGDMGDPQDPAPLWDAQLIAALTESSGGSPLLVLESLRHALDQGLLSLDARVWRCPSRAALLHMLHEAGTLQARVGALSPDARNVLTLLAFAGTPLNRHVLARAMAVDPLELTASVDALERLGIVTRAGDGWVPSHDELADIARVTCDAEAQRHIHHALGMAFEQHAYLVNDDLTWAAPMLRRAARHLDAASEWNALRELFLRQWHTGRTQGDRRPAEYVAAELLGRAVEDPTVRALARAVPVRWRAGLWSPLRQVAAFAACTMIALTIVSASRARAGRAAREQRLQYVADDGNISQATMDRLSWSEAGSLKTEPQTRDANTKRLAREVALHPDLPVVFSPNDGAVAWTEDSRDRTTLDIWLRTAQGIRRLTHHAGDDVAGDWLADGSAVVGATSRWSRPQKEHYNIAVFDTSTGAARPLTVGDWHDNSPAVSPDGTRVAFVREGGDQPPRVCVIDIDGGAAPDCRVIDGQPLGQLVGWRDVHELVLIEARPTDRPLVLYDWSRATARRLLGPWVQSAKLSPDRAFVVGTLHTDGGSGVRDWVIPLDRPADARVVQGNGDGPLRARWWEGARVTQTSITQLTFVDSVRAIPLGFTTRVRVVPRNAYGQEITTPARVRWSSSDTTIATVSATGEVTPHRAGRVELMASLAGWRMARDTFVVRDTPARTVLEEAWDGAWQDRWWAWGEPAPVVVLAANNSPALWNRGDAAYESAAISHAAWPAASGIGVEVRVSTPITSMRGQRLRVVLDGTLDSARMVADDGRGSLPSRGNSEARCSATFPLEGEWGRRRMAFNGGTAFDTDLGPAADTLRSGVWWTLRLQLLPDGRCGAAVNGRVVWLSSEPVARGSSYRVRLGDESLGTKLLHGPVQIWTGVRTDISWAASAMRASR